MNNSTINTNERLKSLIDIKLELKKYNLDDSIRYPPIKQLYVHFNEYLHGKYINTIIDFNEINRKIKVKLDPINPNNNIVVLSR